MLRARFRAFLIFVIALVAANTNIGAAAGGLAAMALYWLRSGKPDLRQECSADAEHVHRERAGERPRERAGVRLPEPSLFRARHASPPNASTAAGATLRTAATMSSAWRRGL